MKNEFQYRETSQTKKPERIQKKLKRFFLLLNARDQKYFFNFFWIDKLSRDKPNLISYKAQKNILFPLFKSKRRKFNFLFEVSL